MIGSDGEIEGVEGGLRGLPCWSSWDMVISAIAWSMEEAGELIVVTEWNLLGVSERD